MIPISFFKKIIFEKEEFFDRKIEHNEDGIDVIIPIINSNLLFEQNLISFYREIPINRLIIGNAGIQDNSLQILTKFPRVQIVDQVTYKSLGYSIAELIRLVKTEWFVYLHADVYLPEGWYDTMRNHIYDYDWFECDQRHVILLEYGKIGKKPIFRAYSGSQMGRKSAFETILPMIEDDFLYRNEDIIFCELLKEKGFKYGNVFDTFHYHQNMSRSPSAYDLVKPEEILNVKVIRSRNRNSEIRMNTMQAKGIIKYTKPNKPYLIKSVNHSINILLEWGAIDISEFKKWVIETNKEWLKYIRIKENLLIRFMIKIQLIINSLFNKLLNFIWAR
ncbi:MAG: glycosyltransferase [Promethearchaeota archaeon]